MEIFMKKRILCALLICCMLLALVPTALFPASAAGEGTGSGASGNAASTADDFADLYIGADGSKTQNGGSLTVLLTAFKDISSVNLLTETWTNVAPGATQNATLGGTWEKAEDGSIGYDLEKWDWNYTLSLDATLLPTDTYTLEIISSVRGLTVGADGKTPIESYAEPTRENISLGRFRGFLWSGNSPWPPRNYNALVTMLYDGAAASDYTWGDLGNLDGIGMGSYMQAYREDTSVMSLTVNLTESPDSYTYEFLKNGETAPSRTLKTTCAKGDTPYVGKFVLGQAMPASYYAVRLYTKPLTAKELTHNRALDILLYIGFSFADYKAVPDADKRALLSAVAEAGFSVTVEGVKDIIDELAAMRAVEALARQKTEYDKLYVGADGSKTQNGGSLSILLSAYDTASVMFFDNKTVWYDKMGNFDGTLIGSLWQPQSGGGVGYGMTVGVATKQSDGSYTYDEARHSNYKEDVYLDFGIDALPKEDFTVEYTVQYRRLQGTDAAGNPIVDYTGDGFWGGALSDAIGQLKAVYERGMGTAISGHYYTRYFTAPAREGWYGGNYLNNQLWMETSRTATTAFTQQIVRDKTEEGANVRLTYQIMKNGVLSKTGVYNSTGALSTAKVQGDKCYTGEEADTVFFLFRRAPVNVYAIRIYDAVLTEEEMLHNHYVDILAYAGLDVAEYYTNLDAEARAFVANFLKESTLLPKAEAEAAIKEALDVCTYSWSKEDSLYVTEGLVGLLSSYNGFSTPTLFGEGSVNWTNVAKEGSFGVLYGKDWQRSADGGLQIRETVDAVYAEKSVFSHHRSRDNFYLGLDYSLLPERDYTLEVVTAPEGITIQNEDGSISPYVDYFSTYGIYNERTFSIGPLRCMGYACNSHVSSGSFEKWFVYQSKGCWDDTSSRNQIGRDRILSLTDLQQPHILP